jgi:hypothetical protein
MTEKCSFRAGPVVVVVVLGGRYRHLTGPDGVGLSWTRMSIQFNSKFIDYQTCPILGYRVTK